MAIGLGAYRCRTLVTRPRKQAKVRLPCLASNPRLKTQTRSSTRSKSRVSLSRRQSSAIGDKFTRCKGYSAFASHPRNNSEYRGNEGALRDAPKSQRLTTNRKYASRSGTCFLNLWIDCRKAILASGCAATLFGGVIASCSTLCSVIGVAPTLKHLFRKQTVLVDEPELILDFARLAPSFEGNELPQVRIRFLGEELR